MIGATESGRPSYIHASGARTERRKEKRKHFSICVCRCVRFSIFRSAPSPFVKRLRARPLPCQSGVGCLEMEADATSATQDVLEGLNVDVTRILPIPEKAHANAHIKGNESYLQMYRESIEDTNGFWSKVR